MKFLKVITHSKIVKYFFYAIPLDFLILFSQRITWIFARLLLLKDWHHETRGRPQFFKHNVNLVCWPFEPERWAFTARGVFARANMNRGCRVLDLCCGDGTYSKFYFSDIANFVDAVDSDHYAIKYARQFHSVVNVNYHELDIVNEAFPSNKYDLFVWNAAICYFNVSEIQIVIEKIIKASASGALFVGMCPKANGWIDHKTEFVDSKALKCYLGQFYANVTVREIEDTLTTSLYFQASEALKIPRII
jgi:SAM-dependent methyltransferase